MSETTYTEQDLQQAVQAGILTEAQHQRLSSFTLSRIDGREMVAADDEPFDLANGFNEIFISLGLAMALGALAYLTLGLFSAILAWVIAPYFIRKRRMTFAGMVIYGGLAFSLCMLTISVLDSGALDWRSEAIATSCAALVFLFSVLFYIRFKLPFVFFGAAMSFMAGVMVVTGLAHEQFTGGHLRFEDFFNFMQAPVMALMTLLCGVGFFIVAMMNDLKDPYRIKRYNQNAFWLHLAAGPTIVNTVVYTLYDIGTTTSHIILLLTVMAIGVISMIVDRRSLLLSTTLYVVIVMTAAFEEVFSQQSVVYVFLIIGTLLTLMGTHWTRLRRKLMQILPDFPYKNKLPHYG